MALPTITFAHVLSGLSAFALLSTARADSVVVFNEIHYNPASPADAEWIELHNQMAVDVDLSKWKVRGGVDFDFPTGTVIPAGGYLVVSSAAGGLGPWSGSLSNSGESLRLRNNSNRLMDEVSYADRGEWPIGPDGSGATLSKRIADSASAIAENWRASAQTGGTPGGDNFPDGASPGSDLPLLTMGSTWRYNESGADLGADWASSAHAVDNTDWFAGAAPIGYETTPAALPEPIVTTVENPALNSTITYYFETDFELASTSGITGLRMRHLIDDGAIFYLNGVEIGSRFNLPGGTLLASTTASPSVSNAAYAGPFSLPTGGLVTGTNRLSVEIHQQAASSSDIVFALELTAETEVQTNAVPDLHISEISGTGETAFQIELANEGDVPLDLEGFVISTQGAIDAEYVLPPGTSISADAFLVLDESVTGLHPQNDDRIFLFTPGRQLLLDAVRADDQPRARSETRGGRMLVPDTATFGLENSFAIESDVVINEIMYHFREDPGTAPGAAVETTLIPLDAIWRYDESGADPGLGWAQSAHPGWPAGQALLGAETTPLVLPEPLRTNFADPRFNGILTYYFEKEFEVTATQLANITGLRLTHVIDDGAVFYLNGVELERYNIADGITVTASTIATAVGNASIVPMPVLPANLLVAGTNRLSVELHQEAQGSSDVIFGAELIALETVQEQPIVERDEEWLELYNKGALPVDLTGWSLARGIGFDFPGGTMIPAGGYLVIARDSAALAAKYPAIASSIVGNFSRTLGNSRETIQLRDANGNPADELTYYDGGKWPSLADGRGSSLELRDPDADNANGRAWAASDESGKSPWQTITYRATGGQSYGLTNWNEFRLGMLSGGEVLIDDVSVVRDPDGAAQQLIQNGNFSTGTDKWRLIGNHRHSAAVPEPGNPGNTVLHLDARGPTDTRHNHIESTFVGNTALLNGQTYEVSFRARWLSGSNLLNTRCYYQQLAKTTQLDRPEDCGTPGSANSRLESNIGPTISGLQHSPPVPAAGESVTVTARITDPDGMGTVVIKSRVDEGAIETHAFTVDANGQGSGTLPGQSAGKVTQFWLEAEDALGATSMAPATGPDSRALVQADDGQTSGLATQEMRLILLDSDRNFMLSTLNLMSNERLGGTAIYNRRDVFHDVKVRLRGSGAGRSRDGDAYRGFNIRYPADQLFRGVQSSTSIDRSARSPAVGQQHEVTIKHMFNHAGIPCMYDELIYLIGPTPTYSGPSQMLMAGYGSGFTESQFDNGGNGTVFNLDITYDPVTTVDGNPESLKPPTPFTHIGTDFRNLGDSEDDYRTSLEIRTGRRRDDYSGLINFCKKMDLPPAQLEAEIGEWMDVDEWLRYSALTVLCGIGDSFVAGGLRHNIRVFVPEDGRGVNALPWDMDFVFAASATSSMLPMTGNLRDVINIPKYKRLYWGHVHDLVTTTFNTGYMNPWLAHYGSVVSQNFSSQSSYITARGNHALSQLPASVPFSITTNSGGDFSVDATQATLEGSGWINVRDFRIAGSTELLSVEWLDGDSWRLTLPLLPGQNALTLEALDFQGALVASDSINITSTVTTPQPVHFLRITELHYHPPATGDHEFIELRNTGTEALDISGVAFHDGVEFTFASGTVLDPDAFILVVRNVLAFEALYGSNLPVAGQFVSGALANSGESVNLRDASGNVIHQFTFDDAWYPSTDGGGYSLVIRDEDAELPAWSTPGGWGISAQPGGNPGAGNTAFSVEFTSWQREHFTEAELDIASISGPLGDANNDGTSNLIHYALGIAPHQTIPPESQPLVAIAGDRLRLTTRRAVDAVDLQIHAEFSSDLSAWTPVFTPLPGATDNGDGTETVTFEDALPSSTRRMGRLSVTLSPP